MVDFMSNFVCRFACLWLILSWVFLEEHTQNQLCLRDRRVPEDIDIRVETVKLAQTTNVDKEEHFATSPQDLFQGKI